MTMNALLHLPAENATLLTDAELADITGANSKALQIEWLNRNEWHYTTNRHGVPRVGRVYANLKLCGIEPSAMITGEADEWQPNRGAIQQ